MNGSSPYRAKESYHSNENKISRGNFGGELLAYQTVVPTALNNP
jgi:hypothetical protein